MNILILEDDEYQRMYLSKIIKDKFIDVRVYEAGTEDEASNFIKGEKIIDLFFLDVNLEVGSGLNFAKSVRKVDKYEVSPIIFISGQMSYIIQALNEVNCFDYLSKPYSKGDIIKIVGKFLRHIKKVEDNNYIFFKDTEGNQKRIYYKDIIFLEYFLKKCTIHTKVGEIKIRGYSLDNIINEINYANILRTHKSFAINLDHIKEIKKVNSKLWEVSFYNYDKKADLSYSYKNNIPIFK